MNYRWIYKTIVVAIIFFSLNNSAFAQGFVLKSNLLCDASGTFNLGTEFSLNEKTSLSLVASYNPWEYSDNAKRKYILVQPEYRTWLRGAFDGYFLGAQLNYAVFNVGGKLPWWMSSFDTIEKNRYQGNLYGIGVTNGYQWIISPRLNIEVAASIGYARIIYDKYDRVVGTPKLEQGVHNYWGITQLGVTLVYYIK